VKLVARIALCAALALSAVNAQAPRGTAPDPLARIVSITVDDVSLQEAFTLLRRGLGVPIAWSGDALPRDFRVTLDVRDIPLGNALAGLLAGSGLEVVVTRLGTVVVVPQASVATEPAAAASRADSPEGARALVATGVHQLDQVVVMGSAVAAAPEREQPTAVGVVGADRIAQLGHGRITDIIRRELPGVIFWDRGPVGPPAPIAAVRGVASFTTRALKTYVDGIEVASPELFTLLDARSAERVELIRGPQGAALYGPDAVNGILQIDTRRGRFGDRRLGWRVEASGGAYDRVNLNGSQPSSDAFASLEGSAPSAAFALHGGYSDISGSAGVPLIRSWSTQAGGRALMGSVIVDASARIARYEYPAEGPAGATQAIEERAIGVTAVQQVTANWQHTLVAGRHAISGAREAVRSPLLPPRLPVGATHEDASRTSVRYGTSFELPRGVLLSGGVEHSQREIERAARRSATTADLSRLYRDGLRATGAFAQTRVRLGTRFVASAGSRAEWISSVEPSLGEVWAHTAGATWSHELDWATLRIRAAWGSGIRPPEPGMNRDVTTATLDQIANPDLAPERQRGIETGADIFFSSGSSVKVTWYDQRATNLIQQVQRRDVGSSTHTYQYQNVGVVRNRGLELEASHRLGRVTAAAIVHLPRSEVLRVAPGYAGELLRGDRLIEVPDAAGSASLRYESGRVYAEGGLTWLGGWTGYDWVLIRRIELGQATERQTPRGYWLEYPGVVRPYVAIGVDVRDNLRASVRVDNPANTAEVIRDNLSPPLGRQLMFALAIRR
jgi:iron complex outermembrane receptor protein